MIAIVISSFNKRVTDGLLEGCLLALKENNHSRDRIEIHEVPGAFELPAKVQYLNSKNKYSCIIALGCIIKGETDHYHYISQAVTNGIMSVTLNSDKNSWLFDNDIIEYKDCSHRHLQFIYHSILDINKKLKKFNREIEVFHTKTKEVFKFLTKNYTIKKIL